MDANQKLVDQLHDGAGAMVVGAKAGAARLLAEADGAIVGTSLKRDGIVSNLIDPERVKRLSEIIHELG